MYFMFIGFRAYVSSELKVHYLQTVIFDDVKDNRGDGYSVSTGKYFCPESGLYNFTVHHMSKDGYLEVGI